MTPEQAIEQAKSGAIGRVYLLLGEEQLRRNAVVKALREATLLGGIAGLNDDQFVAGEAAVRDVLNVAKTLPMMAKRRFVLLRSLERWENKEAELEQLAAYLDAASESTTFVMVASKLDARRRLVTRAKKEGVLVECEPLARAQLPSWIQKAAKERGNTISNGVAELIADITGSDLSMLSDVVERLSLFAGPGKEITEDDVSSCLEIVRPATVWQLVDAVGRRNIGEALASLSRVYDPKEPGVRLLGVLTWSARQLIRFAAASAEGLAPPEAAKRAGAPPFKARELADQLRKVSLSDLERWLETLASIDLALKGGSKRPPQAILEEAIISLCTSPSGATKPVSQSRQRV